MNDELIDIFESVEDSGVEIERAVDGPRPLAPKRTVVGFQISDERDNS